MTDIASKLEKEAARLQARRRGRILSLVVTLMPFASALGAFAVVAGEVSEQSLELTEKQKQLDLSSTKLATVKQEIDAANRAKERLARELAEEQAKLEAARAKSAEAASLLTDISLDLSPKQRTEQATEVLVKDTSLERARDLWREGYAAYQRKDANAKKLFLQARDADPNYAPPYNSLGNLEYNEKNYEKALEWYRKALELQPSYAPAHYNVGLVLDRLGKKAEALEALDRALEVRPDYSLAKQLKAKLTASSVTSSAAAATQQTHPGIPQGDDTRRSPE